MSSRYEVEVKLTSAKDIKNVNWRHGPTRPYAVVWVNPNQKCSTRADEHNDTNPTWDETLVIPLPMPIDDDMTLYIDIVHTGSEPDTKRLIGSARLRLREIIDDVGYGELAPRTLQLKRPSGRPHGKLEVKVSVRDPYGHRANPEPYAAPPYGVSGSYYGVPPREPYYSAPVVAPPSGYPHNPYGGSAYGDAEGEKKSKFGGMGTGLAVGAAAGLVGGLALAEGADYVEDKIADDVAERVEDDLGYDDGDDF